MNGVSSRHAAVRVVDRHDLHSSRCGGSRDATRRATSGCAGTLTAVLRAEHPPSAPPVAPVRTVTRSSNSPPVECGAPCRALMRCVRGTTVLPGLSLGQQERLDGRFDACDGGAAAHRTTPYPSVSRACRRAPGRPRRTRRTRPARRRSARSRRRAPCRPRRGRPARRRTGPSVPNSPWSRTAHGRTRLRSSRIDSTISNVDAAGA